MIKKAMAAMILLFAQPAQSEVNRIYDIAHIKAISSTFYPFKRDQCIYWYSTEAEKMASAKRYKYGDLFIKNIAINGDTMMYQCASDKGGGYSKNWVMITIYYHTKSRNWQLLWG